MTDEPHLQSGIRLAELMASLALAIDLGTGRPVKIQIAILDRIVNGRIVEHRARWDVMALMQQLGVVPASAR